MSTQLINDINLQIAMTQYQENLFTEKYRIQDDYGNIVGFIKESHNNQAKGYGTQIGVLVPIESMLDAPNANVTEITVLFRELTRYHSIKIA